MSDAECRERLTRLETNQTIIIKDYSEHSAREENYHEKNESLQKEQLEMIKRIEIKQASMTGFWSGMVFIATAISAGVGLAINKIFTGT